MTIEKPPVTASPKQFLNHLRAETSHLHTQLEQLPLSIKITGENLIIEDYILYLQRMLHIHQYVEHCVFPQLYSIVADINKRKKTRLILNDLHYLNAIVPESRFAINTGLLSNTAFALGVMYVTEGSTLGGRFILKNIERCFNLNENKGASFFAGYRSETGSMWKYFLQSLESYQTQTFNDNMIIEGAIAAFENIYYYMQ